MALVRPPAQPLTDGVVVVRPLCEADREAVLATMRDPVVRRWLNMPSKPRDGDFDSLWRTARQGVAAGNRIDLSVVDAEGASVGAVVASLRHRDNWEIAYMAPEAGRGRGLMTRAVGLVCDWLFAQGVGRVEVRTHPDNAASQRLAERVGFQREGRERSSIWLHGARADAVVWSLLADDPR